MTYALLTLGLSLLGYLAYRTLRKSQPVQPDRFARMQALFPDKDTRRVLYREPDARWRVK